MGTFTDLSDIKQWGALVLGAVVLSAALYFTMFKSQVNANAQAQQQLDAKVRENAELEAYSPKLAEIERQLASLKQQSESDRSVQPEDDKTNRIHRMTTHEATTR